MTTVTTLIHSRFPYHSRSVLLQKPRPHGDHICIHVYVDVLHGGQVVLRTD
jgi:hypothetical protein